MSDSFDLETPDHFTAGTVGVPGQRTFYLQVREARALVTLKIEKEQVGTLGEYLGALLANLRAVTDEIPDDLALLEPVEPAWAVGSIAVGYDEERDRVLIVATETVEDEESGAQAATARFRLTRAQAAAFVDRVRALVKAGRPLCPLCSRPKDPEGHACPRSNGHVVTRE